MSRVVAVPFVPSIRQRRRVLPVAPELEHLVQRQGFRRPDYLVLRPMVAEDP